MKGDGKIGYILLVEFKNSEKFILDEIMTMLNVYSGEGISETNNRNISFHGIAVYPDQRRILAADKEVFLSHYEFDVFLHLAQHPRQVFTKEQIYEAVWDDIPVNVVYDLQHPEETQEVYRPGIHPDCMGCRLQV